MPYNHVLGLISYNHVCPGLDFLILSFLPLLLPAHSIVAALVLNNNRRAPSINVVSKTI